MATINKPHRTKVYVLTLTEPSSMISDQDHDNLPLHKQQDDPQHHHVLKESPDCLSQRLEVVPDGLLALTKDARYIQECQALVLQVLSTLWPRRRQLEQESWILASALCLALGLTQTAHRTTLGMETVGLQFPNESQRWKFVLAVVSSMSWVYVFAAPPNGSLNRSNNDSASNGLTTFVTRQQQHNQQDRSIYHQNDDSSSHMQDDLLRGSQRRQFHEAQRQAMLQRASQAANAEQQQHKQNTIHTTIHSNGRNNENTSEAAASSMILGTTIECLSRRIALTVKTMLWKIAQSMALAMAVPEGPHHLHNFNQQQQQQHQRQQQQSSLAAWLVRWQLAHFCFTGRYPSWIHRWTGHALQVEQGKPTRLYHRPTTARIVGTLLAIQTVAQAARAISTTLSRWYLQRAARSISTDGVNHAGPPVVTFPCAPTAAASPRTAFAGSAGNICSVCKIERTHPAAPAACGHVFCWNCLIQWVSSVRPACPLCRATCQPQDVVALHNYIPSESPS